MRVILRALLDNFLNLFRTRQSLQLEVLALRHQLAVNQRTVARPRTRREDRLLWSLLSRHWTGWREALVLVRPETVVRWRRRRFRDHWRRLSRRGTPGRPTVPAELRCLIQRMSSANPLWGAPRVEAELRMLGIEVARTTVAKYMVRHCRSPSPSWRSLLQDHLDELIAVDFFTVPTVRNRVLYVILVLLLKRRRILHFNVTANPTAAWTAQQIVEAFAWEAPPRFLQRDRNKIYGEAFRARVRGLGLEEILTAPRSPWQNGYVERVIGTIRRECLDHVLVLSDRHPRRVISRYLDYYHCWRPHSGLAMDAPYGRRVQGIHEGRIVEVPEVYGLHHHYERRVA